MYRTAAHTVCCKMAIIMSEIRSHVLYLRTRTSVQHLLLCSCSLFCPLQRYISSRSWMDQCLGSWSMIEMRPGQLHERPPVGARQTAVCIHEFMGSALAGFVSSNRLASAARTYQVRAPSSKPSAVFEKTSEQNIWTSVHAPNLPSTRSASKDSAELV